MSETLRIRWQVEDGYVSGDRPQSTVVHLKDLMDDCQTEDDVREAVNEYVQEDFEQKVSPGIAPNSIEAAITAWREAKQEQESHQ